MLDFGDFALWRVRPAGGLFVGGFARATRIKGSELAPDAQAVAALLAAESDICSHCNADHADALAELAGRPGSWQMVAADVDGCDLACDEEVVRIAWPEPVADGGGVRKALITLLRDLRRDRGATL